MPGSDRHLLLALQCEWVVKKLPATSKIGLF